jgi:hypothetical protein
VERKPGAKLRSDEQEHHIRRSLEVSWHKTTKPCGLTGSVNDALVQGKFMSLSGEICLTGDRLYPLRLGYINCLGALSRSSGRSEQIDDKTIAPALVTTLVIKQKSADGIVAKRSP